MLFCKTMQAELLVATFVKVNNVGALLATQKVQVEARNMFIFLVGSLLLENCVYSWLAALSRRLSDHKSVQRR